MSHTTSKKNRKTKSIAFKINLMICIVVLLVVSILSVVNYVENYNLLYDISTEKCITGTNILSRNLGDEEDAFTTDRTAFLDGLKADTGAEYTIFKDDIRLYTTVINNGERAVGTQLSKTISDIVIKGKESYIGEAEILGVPHLCSYVPLIDDMGEVIGVLFSGVRIDQITPQLISDLISNVVIGIIILFLAMVFSMYLIIQKVSKPIRLCAARLELLAKGDLQSKVPQINTKDEIGILSNSTEIIVTTLYSIVTELSSGMNSIANGNFTYSGKENNLFIGDLAPLVDAYNKITNNLSDTLFQINTAAEQVSSGSEQVSVGSQSLAQGATEQASSVQELSATIEEITQKINLNYQNVQNADLVNQKAIEAFTSFAGQIHEMMKAMSEIDNKSKEIEKIIKAIDDIAFQTNILSLNAAVEAARAGQAGKGFAVVADEVRSLATKSAQSAKDTAVLIDDTISVVRNGNKIATATSESVNIILENAKELGALVEIITATSAEEANAVNQINVGVEQISTVVQINASTAEQSAAASEELSGQSNMLKNLAGQFILKDDSNNGIH